MRTWRCNACEYQWQSEDQQLMCPSCEEKRLNYGFKRWIAGKERETRNAEMRGVPRSDRQRCCEGCGMAMKGYCHAEYDAATGATYLSCSNCGHETEVFNKATRW